MNDLILGCVTNYNFDQIKPWVNSIEKSGFTGHKMMIVYNVDFDVVQKLQERDFTVFALGKDETAKKFTYNKTNWNIVVERFYHSWLFLNNIETPIRYVIATDVKDVIFQRNPSEWIDQTLHRGSDFHTQFSRNKLIVSSEGIEYKNEMWGNHNMRQSFPFAHTHMLHQNIWNCGVLAGSYDYIKDLFLNIFTICSNMPSHIPGGGGPDQAALNLLMSMHPYKDVTYYATSQDAWAAQLGTTADPKKIELYRQHLTDSEPVFEDGIVKNKDGVPYYIVHQYDRVNQASDILRRYV